MEEPVTILKTAVREVLGEGASRTFLYRMDVTLDEAAKSREALAEACVKVEKMVGIFIGKDEAKVVGQRCRDILKTDA